MMRFRRDGPLVAQQLFLFELTEAFCDCLPTRRRLDWAVAGAVTASSASRHGDAMAETEKPTSQQRIDGYVSGRLV